MKNILLNVLLILSLWAPLAQSAPAETKTKTYQQEAFSLAIPTDVEVTKTTPIDFDLLSFERNKTKILGAYVGNAPDFSPEEAPKTRKVVTSTINGLKAKVVTWNDDKGLYCGETLLETGEDWPGFVHFFYRGLSKENFVQVTSIINSTRATPEKP